MKKRRAGIFRSSSSVLSCFPLLESLAGDFVGVSHNHKGPVIRLFYDIQGPVHLPTADRAEQHFPFNPAVAAAGFQLGDAPVHILQDMLFDFLGWAVATDARV